MRLESIFFCLFVVHTFAVPVSLWPSSQHQSEDQDPADNYIVILNPHAEINRVLDKLQKIHDIFDNSKLGSFVHNNLGFKHYSDITLRNKVLGFVARIDAQIAKKLQHDDDIMYLEKDSKVFAHNIYVQPEAPWGLARLSSRSSTNGSYFGKYYYDATGGTGVTSYILDSGANIQHVDFGGRAKWGPSFVSGSKTSNDSFGHGSHCAGVVGSATYGVAKNASLVAVKVLNDHGIGQVSDIVKGIYYVISEHEKRASLPGFKGTTMNMSFGTGNSTVLAHVLQKAYDAGIFLVASAGNTNSGKCGGLPAASDLVFTVGAIDNTDARAEFSDFGPCVDVYAPGVEIYSTWFGNSTSGMYFSGSSMAAPHITGLMTYLLSLAPGSDSMFQTAGPAGFETMRKAILQFGIVGSIRGLDNTSHNVMAYNGGVTGDLSAFWKL